MNVFMIGYPVTVEVEHTRADDLVEVTADTLPDEIAAVLALTPHVADDATWQEREAAAQAANEQAAAVFMRSCEIFAEKHVNYEPNGDVLWA